MHRKFTGIASGVLLAATLACGLVEPGTLPQVGVSTIVAETVGAATAAFPAATETPAVPVGLTTAFPGGSMIIPEGLASGITAETVAAIVGQQDAPWWDMAPEHMLLALQGYPLTGRFHEPQIVIYPAAEYAAVNESAAANIQTLQSMLSTPDSVPDSKHLPHITFFNAGPVFQAQVAVVPFQSGYGIRALTEYAQYAAPVNNNDMFYHFEGLTADGKKYIVAILPVSAPLLQADSAQSSVPPAGGITFPDYSNPDPANFENYYSAVSNLLNSTAAMDFGPSLTSLDALIGSLSVTP